MDAFPAFVPLAGRRVVIVGEGEMADGKAVLFEGSPAHVERRAADEHALEPSLYAGATLVFIAAEREDYARAAAQAARAGGALLVNVVDKPALCDFYTPALVDRGSVVAAVGTTGAGPLLAQRLKGEIENVLPATLGDLAAVLRAIQQDVRARLPDFADRRAFLTTVLDGPSGEAALRGDRPGAIALALAALLAHGAQTAEPMGGADAAPSG